MSFLPFCVVSPRRGSFTGLDSGQWKAQGTNGTMGWQKGHGGRVSQGQLLRSIFLMFFFGLKDCEE